MRLIDLHEAEKNAVKVTQYDEGGWGITLKAVPLEELRKLPTIEAEVVKRGRWLVRHKGQNNWVDCSECGTVGSPFWKRCPVCEAKMDLEE